MKNNRRNFLKLAGLAGFYSDRKDFLNNYIRGSGKLNLFMKTANKNFKPFV